VSRGGRLKASCGPETGLVAYGSVDQSEHVRILAEELLADIELSRLPSDQLVLKAARLARLVGHQEMMRWLSFELHGYPDTPETEQYLDWTGRWTDKEKRFAWWGGIGQIEANIGAYETKLSDLKMPSLSGDMLIPVTNSIQANQNKTVDIITQLAGIRSKVIALLHRYTTEIYYEAEFSTRQETIFEGAKLRIDALLAPVAKDTLSQVDAVYRRLASDDPEAISQALTTCRRLVDGFADQVFPPQAEPRIRDGVTIDLGAQKHLNRIKAFVDDNCDSGSRASRLKRRLSDLYERVNVGIHADVSSDEARFLFLDTYLLLGEVLSLADVDRTAAEPEQTED
jgi:hypothetical protein